MCTSDGILIQNKKEQKEPSPLGKLIFFPPLFIITHVPDPAKKNARSLLLEGEMAEACVSTSPILKIYSMRPYKCENGLVTSPGRGNAEVSKVRPV